MGCDEKSAWQFEHWFNLTPGLDVVLSKPHIRAPSGSNKLEMQPFLAVGFVFGLAGGLATTLRV